MRLVLVSPKYLSCWRLSQDMCHLAIYVENVKYGLIFKIYKICTRENFLPAKIKSNQTAMNRFKGGYSIWDRIEKDLDMTRDQQ